MAGGLNGRPPAFDPRLRALALLYAVAFVRYCSPALALAAAAAGVAAMAFFERPNRAAWLRRLGLAAFLLARAGGEALAGAAWPAAGLAGLRAVAELAVLLAVCGGRAFPFLAELAEALPAGMRRRCLPALLLARRGAGAARAEFRRRRETLAMRGAARHPLALPSALMDGLRQWALDLRRAGDRLAAVAADPIPPAPAAAGWRAALQAAALLAAAAALPCLDLALSPLVPVSLR